MLIRFIAKNIYSFKEETDFNLFPNKTQRLNHHKIAHNNVEILRLSAIYGANGSGKSNLIKAISLLDTMIKKGKLLDDIDDNKFKLCEANSKIPISLGIEFYIKSKIYYYTITFENDIILNEYLAESKNETDVLIFDRNFENGTLSINFFKDYIKNERNRLFVDILSEKLIQKNELLLSFLNDKYSDEFVDIKIAYEWFKNTLVIIKPNAKPEGIAHILDTDNNLIEFANYFVPNLNTGISNISVEKKLAENVVENVSDDKIGNILSKIKKDPNFMSVVTHKETNEEYSIVNESGTVFIKRLITNHLNDKGTFTEFSLGMESDGTKRLIDFLPAINDILKEETVYLIDEIERSIHPITIKQIISKISADKTAKGQLIFTTHESCLLDQEILRPDEIWFAQKDIDGASKLYPLSDFNIHNTANIENGYLNGRYGGIPFLSNLKDLNW